MEATAQGLAPPDDDRLERVVVNLPRSMVRRLDERTGPGRSRSAVVRDLITEAERTVA